jgi:hypothetical protein
MSMKNSNNNIGNRTRDLPTCSAVPQPTVTAYAHTRLHSVELFAIKFVYHVTRLRWLLSLRLYVAAVRSSPALSYIRLSRPVVLSLQNELTRQSFSVTVNWQTHELSSSATVYGILSLLHPAACSRLALSKHCNYPLPRNISGNCKYHMAQLQHRSRDRVYKPDIRRSFLCPKFSTGL